MNRQQARCISANAHWPPCPAQEKIELRRQQIGFVFQTFGLLPYLSITENVQVPLRLLRISPQQRQALVDEALERVGLSARAHHRTYELSGGEQQRAAIAGPWSNVLL